MRLQEYETQGSAETNMFYAVTVSVYVMSTETSLSCYGILPNWDTSSPRPLVTLFLGGP